MDESHDTIWTYSDLQNLPEDRKTHHIIKGEMHMVPAPTSSHQSIVGNIYRIMGNFLATRDLGRVFVAPLDVIFDETNVVQPDIVFVSKDRENLIEEKGIAGAPDLIVEVISPSTQKLDETTKKDLYESRGVAEYLIVYPKEKKVLAYALEGGFYQKKGVFLPSEDLPLQTLSLALALDEVFKF